MRGFAFFALAVTGAIAICSGCQNNPDAAPVNNAELKRKTEQNYQQLDKVDEQIERTNKMLDRSEEQNDTFEIILNHPEEIIIYRSEEYSDPFDMILLDKWVKQLPLQQ